MSKSEKVGTQSAPVELPPSVSFYFTKQLKAPADFTHLKLEDKITVLVTGTVSSLRQSTDPDYSAEISVEIEKIDINKASPKTIADAKTIARERVKDFK